CDPFFKTDMPCAKWNAIPWVNASGVAAVGVDVELDRDFGVEERIVKRHARPCMGGIVKPSAGDERRRSIGGDLVGFSLAPARIDQNIKIRPAALAFNRVCGVSLAFVKMQFDI